MDGMGKCQLPIPAVPQIAAHVRASVKERRAVSARKPLVLMVGMHLTKTRGGITTLTAAILGSAIKDDYDFVYIASQAEDYGRFRKLLLAVFATVRFAAVCVFQRPRLIYIHVGSNASLYRESAFILLAKLLGKQVLAHFHAGDFEEYCRRQPATGKQFICRALGFADLVIAVSDESAYQLTRANERLKISIIPNVIDVSAFYKMPIKSRQKQDETVQLLFVGAAQKLKGEIDLIDALVILKKRGLKVKAAIVGYNAESILVRTERLGIADLIEHSAPVSMRDRVSFFETADIFVLPTYAEAMPISVIEAMAAGLAIVTTPVGGIPEILDDGVEGMLIPVGNVEALAEKIEYLIKNPAVRLKLGERAKQRCREQMDFTRYIERIGSEIGQLVEPKI